MPCLTRLFFFAAMLIVCVWCSSLTITVARQYSASGYVERHCWTGNTLSFFHVLSLSSFTKIGIVFYYMNMTGV